MNSKDKDLFIYNSLDAYVLHEIDAKLMRRLDKTGNLAAYEWTLRFIPPLMDMMSRGVLVDQEGIKKLKKQAKADLKAQQAVIAVATEGIIEKPGSSKQCQAYFYTHLGVKPYKNKVTRKPTADKTALLKLAKPTSKRDGFSVAKLILDYRAQKTMLDRYYNAKIDPDGRLRCAYNPVGGIKDARLSSRKSFLGRGFNMQTAPKGFRKYWLFDEGCMGYAVDLSNADSRVVAYIAPEPKMIEVFESGGDLHTITAALLLGKEEKDVTKEERQEWGKRGNHSLGYAMGIGEFSDRYLISLSQAREYSEAWHSLYPGVRKYHEWVQQQLRKDKTLTNLYGRKRLFLDRWGEQLFKSAYAFIPASTVADKINRDIMVPMFEDRETFGKVELLLNLHDEIFFQVSMDETQEVHLEILRAVKERLETPLQWLGREFVIPATFKRGTNFGEMEGFEVDE